MDWVRRTTTILSFSLLCLALLGDPQELLKDYDSIIYCNVAQAISSGAFFKFLPPELREMDYLARTPGFPVLLLLAQKISPGLYQANFLLNVVFSALTLIAWTYAARALVSPLAISIALIVVNLKFKFHEMLLTESITFNLLLIVLAVLFTIFSAPSIRKFAALGFLCSVAVLIRPALMLLPIFAIGGLALSRLRRTKTAWIVLLLSFSPIVAWMSYNYFRIGAFALGGVQGIQLFTIGSIVGDAPTISTDPEDLKKVISKINDEHYTIPDSFPLGLADFTSKTHDQIFKGFINNTYGVLPNISSEPSWTVVRQNEVAGIYAKRAISANRDKYLKMVAYNNSVHLRFWYVFLLFMISIAYFYRLGAAYQTFAAIGLVALLLHTLQVFLYSLISVVHSRYFSPTFAVVTFFTLLSAAMLVARVFKGRKFDP